MSKAIRFKRKIVRERENGGSVAFLSKKYNIPVSTIYDWLDSYGTIYSRRNCFTTRQYKTLERQKKELETILELVVKSPFIQNVKLREREKYIQSVIEKKDIKPYLLCRAFDVDHATLHHFLYDSKGDDAWYIKKRERIQKLVLSIFVENGSTYGAKKILTILRDQYRENASIEYVRKIMRENGIRGAKPQPIKRRANVAYKARIEKLNIIKQDFFAPKPNIKWVLDCKMLYCKGRPYQLCAILDLFSRRVIAYRIGNRECGRLVAATIRQAIDCRKPEKELVLHTDNSRANISYRVEKLLRESGVKHSYSRAYNPYDNSAVESFFSHFSTEFLADAYKIHPFRSKKEMYERIEKYIYDYNFKRPHEYNDGLSPVQKETKSRLSYSPKKATRCVKCVKCVTHQKKTQKMNHFLRTKRFPWIPVYSRRFHLFYLL